MSFSTVLKPKYFFIATLLGMIGFYLFTNIGLGPDALSSDVWGYQFLELQKRFNYWSDVPPSYNQSEYYIGFPLFYYLNPGLEKGLANYHALSILIIILTYLVTGFVAQKIFNNWYLASLAGLLVLIPRFIFPTRIGLLDLGSLRGNILAAPFYFLLSYYWLIYGIKNHHLNILLGLVAGALVYIYPPAGIITIFTYGVTALVLYRGQSIKPLIFFTFAYLVITTPFWINHFGNPNTSMLEVSAHLSAEEIAAHSEIIQYKFRGSGFLKTVDFAEIKRGIWDGAPLIAAFILSMITLGRKRDQIFEKEKLLTRINISITATTLAFIALIEILNYQAISRGGLPVFIDHLRPMRAIGFVLVMQSVVFVSLLVKNKKQIFALIFAILLIITPIRFSAPLIRIAVRMTVPESIRLKYNLAPIVREADYPDFENLQLIAHWTKENLLQSTTKIFVFDEHQDEFRFKLISRHNTNLTNKEGNLWVTSGFENSQKWYAERMKYKAQVSEAKSFESIIDFALELDSTHILLPRGRFSELYEKSNKTLPVIYENSDYRILEL